MTLVNGLPRKTAYLILAVDTMCITGKVPHYVETKLYWLALQRACKCQGGSAGECKDGHEK